MKKIITTLLFIICVLFANAQEEPAAPTSFSSQSGVIEDDASHKWGISLNLTTNGIGGELSRSISKSQKFIARFGGTYYATSIKDYAYNNGSKSIPQYLIINANIVLGSVGAFVDWHPFNNAFKVTGGLAYMLTNVKGNAQLRDSTKQGVINIPPDEVGQILYKYNLGSITPYLGIGFGRAIPIKHRVGVSFEIGTFYTGVPTLDFSTTKMLEPTTPQGAVLNSKLYDFQWLPKLSLNINIKLTK